MHAFVPNNAARCGCGWSCLCLERHDSHLLTLHSPVSRLQQHEGQVQDLRSQLQHMWQEQQHLQMQLQAAAAAAKAAAEAQEVRHHARVFD